MPHRRWVTPWRVSSRLCVLCVVYGGDGGGRVCGALTHTSLGAGCLSQVWSLEGSSGGGAGRCTCSEPFCAAKVAWPCHPHATLNRDCSTMQPPKPCRTNGYHVGSCYSKPCGSHLWRPRGLSAPCILASLFFPTTHPYRRLDGQFGSIVSSATATAIATTAVASCR